MGVSFFIVAWSKNHTLAITLKLGIDNMDDILIKAKADFITKDETIRIVYT